MDRTGSQVGRSSAAPGGRGSWKSSLPLINLKRRPAAAPPGSAVYLWNGIIATGPFVTDIDNPYAFAAYNVGATKLYRPFISALLGRDNCLEVRCMSEICRQRVGDIFGDSVAAKARLSYPTVPPSVRPRASRDDSDCRFLFIGTQFEIKGGAALLSAFRSVRVACPNATLDLVTHLPEGFEGIVRDQPGVTVYPADLTRAEIAARFIARSDVLVHPTHMDSFGMVVLESIAAGLPVIASDLYAIPEMIEDGRNGFLVAPPVAAWRGSEPEPAYFADTIALAAAIRQADGTAFEAALTNAMIELARRPDMRSRMGSESRRIAKGRFGA